MNKKNMKFIQIGMLLLIQMISNAAENFEIKGQTLVPANPHWEYAPYDSAELSPRASGAHGMIIHFVNDTAMTIFSGSFNGREGQNEFSMSEGDGGCFFEGQYEKIREGIQIRYKEDYCWKVLKAKSGSKKKEPMLDTLFGPTIPMGGAHNSEVFMMKGKAYIFNNAAYWKLIETESWPLRKLKKQEETGRKKK